MIVPVGDGSAICCWLCGHAVGEHECELGAAMAHECECLPEQIYPAALIAELDAGRSKSDRADRAIRSIMRGGRRAS